MTAPAIDAYRYAATGTVHLFGKRANDGRLYSLCGNTVLGRQADWPAASTTDPDVCGNCRRSRPLPEREQT